MVIQVKDPHKFEIGTAVLLCLLFLFSFSCTSTERERNFCDRLAEIKTMPFRGEPVEDEVYNGLMKMGDSAIPCLIEQLTNTTKTHDPRRAPIYGKTTVGDVALFVLLDITKVQVGDVFPEEIMSKWEDRGIYAYFAFVENETNRRMIQHRWRIWYEKHTIDKRPNQE